MPRFRDILKGKRPRKTISLPILAPEEPGAVPGPVPLEAHVEIDVTVLPGDQEALVLEEARAFATKRGVPDPKPGDPIYDLGLMVHTLVATCLDPEVRAEERPFFESVDELLAGLDRDRIAFLHALQDLWQDQCSPYRDGEPDEDHVFQFAIAMADSEDPQRSPFGTMRPGLLWSYMRSTARLLVIAVRNRSQSGSTSEADSPSGTSSEKSDS
jgi:hypothetical protein